MTTPAPLVPLIDYVASTGDLTVLFERDDPPESSYELTLQGATVVVFNNSPRPHSIHLQRLSRLAQPARNLVTPLLGETITRIALAQSGFGDRKELSLEESETIRAAWRKLHAQM